MEARTIPALLVSQASLLGDRVLARDDSRSIAYADGPERAAAVAGSLAAAGVRPGDRVVVISENRLEMVELFLGCTWLGAVFVPVNTALRGEQLAHVLRDADASLVVVEETLADMAQGERNVVPIDGLPTGPPGDSHPAEEGGVSAILYTSGTTGPSKGVLCPHAQWYWWGVKTARALGTRHGDVLYTCLPFFHTNAINTFAQALVYGGTFHLGPRFSASRFWERLAASDADVTFLFGAMVHILSRAAPVEAPPHHCRVALAPGAPPERQAYFAEQFGIRLVDAWGSTETNVVIAADDPMTPPGSIGRVLDGFAARVVDDDEVDVEPGVPGQLLVRADEPHVFALGYHGLPEQTREAWRNGWFRTGDRVVRDRDGWYWFRDRLKDSIRRRGENISSYEVEAALAGHPAVAAVAVVPVPSELGEDEVLAFVIPRAGATPTAEELIGHCETRLAYFAIPRYVQFVDELPLTSNGKVEKFRLRERGVGPDTWDRERAGYTLRR